MVVVVEVVVDDDAAAPSFLEVAALAQLGSNAEKFSTQDEHG